MIKHKKTDGIEKFSAYRLLFYYYIVKKSGNGLSGFQS
jgi:hypothetical protein